MAITVNGGATNLGYSGVSTSGAMLFSPGGVLHTGDCMLVATIAHTATSTTANPITSITDSAGNTWLKYTDSNANSGWHTADTNSGTQRSFAVEVWYTKNATCNTTINITVNHANNVDAAMVCLSGKILGYDTTQPFDQNASLPKKLTINGGVAAETITGISTDTAHVMGMWSFGAFSSNINTSNVVFNGVTRLDQSLGQKNNTEFVKGQQANGTPVTSAYSAVTFTSPTTADNVFIIGYALTSDVQAPPVVNPLDGTRILEWGSNSIAARRYQEADYDSIWSRGDRVANGLLTVGFYGFTSMLAPMSQGFDNIYGTGLGNGPTPQGDTSAPFYPAMSTAVWWDTTPWPLELHGIKWLGTESIADDGSSWRVVGGFGTGSILSDSYALEFDNFTIVQTAVDAELGGSMLSRTLDFTPRSPISWPHYELIRVLDESYAGSRLANEFLLRVTHSILDGGDRRSTNGRPDKQVAFSMSSNWTFSTGGTLADPAIALFDGKYHRTLSGEAIKGGAPTCLIKSVTGSGHHPQTTVGEWLQFSFPRKVRMHHLVFNLANGDLEVNSGGNPTIYGKWHWEVSDGGAYVQVGGSWSFTENSTFMVAPFASPAAGFGLPDDGGHANWRMVLEAGPAFGDDKLLAQVIFHLDDPGNLNFGYSVAFTDDIDEASPVLLPPTAGDPYVLLFTDGISDVLSLTLSITPNPILTAAFTDGTDDQLTLFSDLSPSQIIQTFVRATGR